MQKEKKQTNIICANINVYKEKGIVCWWPHQNKIIKIRNSIK